MATTVIPLSPWVNRYLSEGRQLGVFGNDAYKTKRHQISNAESFAGGVPAHELTPEQIRAYLNRPNKRTGRPLSKMTRWTNFMVLKQFYLWLSDETPVSEDVMCCLDGCPFPWRLPPQPCYSVDEMKKIFKAAAEDFGRPAIACRNSLMLLFAYYMCLRTGSIMSIKLSSVDFETMTCMAYVKNQDMQLILIPSFICERLREYVEVYRPMISTRWRKCDYLFLSNRGSQFERASVARIMSRILTAAGIPRATSRGFHGVRRAGLTHAMIHDKLPLHVVSVGLGMHSKITTTQGYLGTTPEVMRESVNSTTMHPIHGNTQRKIDREHQKRIAREIAKEKKI